MCGCIHSHHIKHGKSLHRTDHMPLEVIFRKPSYHAPPRFQTPWLLKATFRKFRTQFKTQDCAVTAYVPLPWPRKSWLGQCEVKSQSAEAKSSLNATLRGGWGLGEDKIKADQDVGRKGQTGLRTGSRTSLWHLGRVLHCPLSMGFLISAGSWNSTPMDNVYYPYIYF